MKIIYTLLISLLYITCAAQKSDSTRVRKTAIDYNLIEESTELKSKPHIKNGSAEVFLNDKLMATGLYNQNERVGRWRFFKYKTDTISQIYNYNLKKIEYNVPDTTIAYNIDSLNQGDKVLYPVKIGNMHDLYSYLTSSTKIPEELFQKNTDYKVTFFLTINEFGKITKLIVDYKLENNGKTYELVDQNHQYKDFDFSPAIVNGKAVDSQMILKVMARITN
ncbi:hypothetical protein [Pedobacter aquatilis]|uniref:hypothetical protein n=1 Tax=Pedobacter aquatilis TaxID=351343 RepID=UPI00292CB9BC|nr:hypothetical protein [Pedobacter aquatilis]